MFVSNAANKKTPEIYRIVSAKQVPGTPDDDDASTRGDLFRPIRVEATATANDSDTHFHIKQFCCSNT